MPTLNNPYSFESPLAGSLDTLAKSFMSGPTEAQKILYAEHALKAKREREGRESLAAGVRNIGQPGYSIPGQLSSAFLGGVDPGQVGTAQRVYNANTYGAADPRTDSAVVGAGGSYGSTADAFRQTKQVAVDNNNRTLAEQQRQFDMKPTTIGTDRGPMIVPQNEAYNKPAVEDLGKVKGDAARRAMLAPGGIDNASDATKTFIGAEKSQSQSPKNYMTRDGKVIVTYDGVTDARSGAPLPEGGAIAGVQGTPDQAGLGKTVTSKLQEQQISQNRFGALLNHTRELAAKDPTNFGVAGFVKGALQDTSQMAGNVATGLGYSGVEEALKDVRQKAAASGVNPSLLAGVFDPSLSALHTAADLLTFAAAEALANQSGRSVSDKDIAAFKSIIGDPSSWMMTQEKFMSKLDTVGQILNLNQQVTNNALRGGPSGTAAPAAPAAAPVPPPPTAAGAPPTQAVDWQTYFGGR